MIRFARLPTWLVGTGLAIAACARLAADTLILPPAGDGYIRASQSAAQTANTTNGLLLIGNTITTDDILRGLLTFDLSTPLLDAATIHGASLVLTVSERDTSNGGSADADRTVQLLALDASFSEADATWTERHAGEFWTTPGSDLGAHLAATIANPAVVTTGDQLILTSTELTGRVRTALGTSLDLALRLSPEDTTRAIFRLGSREGAKVTGPRLVLNYTPAAATPSTSVTPVPGHPERPASPRYTVTAGGRSVPVKAERFGFDVAMFTLGDEPATVSINVADDFTVHTLKPARHNLDVRRAGNVLDFTLAEPLRLVLQIPGRTPLALIVTPPGDPPPSPDDPDVLYFGPGVTVAGVIRPADGQTIYLAPGALVKGRIEARGVKDVTVRGRGLLETEGYSNRADRTHGILFEDAANITVQGIGVRSYYTWWQTLFLNARDVTVSDVNIFGLGVNTDGVDIDAVKDFVVRDSFIRAEDDGLGWHSLDAATNGEMITERALAENIVIWNTGAGNGVRIGASMEAQLWRDITLRDLDILEHATNGAGLYSDYSDWAWMQDLRFENITIDRPSNPIVFQITKTGYSNATGFLDERGHIDGLVFKNITAAGGTIRLLGHDATHRIHQVRFIDCTNAGVPLTSAAQLTLNAHVTDLAFNQELPPRAASAPGVFEAEDLETLTNRRPQFIADEPTAGQGRLRVFRPSSAGDWLEHTLDAPAAGPHRLKIRFRRTPASGRVRLAVNGTDLALEHDLHSVAPSYQEIDYGDVFVDSAGPLRLRLTLTGRNPAGTGLDVEIDTIRLLSPLEAWRDLHFQATANAGDAADNADPDGDGLPNLLEFATGQSPLSPQDPAATVTTEITSSRRLALAFTRLFPAPVEYNVESSDDLVDWTIIATLSRGHYDWSGIATITESTLDDTRRRTLVEDTTDLAASSRRFLRLRVISR